MKKFLVVLALLALTGCDARTTETTYDYILPKGLESCKVFELEGAGAASQDMTVLYCPGKTTTNSSYHCGKGCEANLAVVTE